MHITPSMCIVNDVRLRSRRCGTSAGLSRLGTGHSPFVAVSPPCLGGRKQAKKQSTFGSFLGRFVLGLANRQSVMRVPQTIDVGLRSQTTQEKAT